MPCTGEARPFASRVYHHRLSCRNLLVWIGRMLPKVAMVTRCDYVSGSGWLLLDQLVTERLRGFISASIPCLSSRW
jgi:hypothetical protein